MIRRVDVALPKPCLSLKLVSGLCDEIFSYHNLEERESVSICFINAAKAEISSSRSEEKYIVQLSNYDKVDVYYKAKNSKDRQEELHVYGAVLGRASIVPSNRRNEELESRMRSETEQNSRSRKETVAAPIDDPALLTAETDYNKKRKRDNSSAVFAIDNHKKYLEETKAAKRAQKVAKKLLSERDAITTVMVALRSVPLEATSVDIDALLVGLAPLQYFCCLDTQQCNSNGFADTANVYAEFSTKEAARSAILRKEEKLRYQSNCSSMSSGSSSKKKLSAEINICEISALEAVWARAGAVRLEVAHNCTIREYIEPIAAIETDLPKDLLGSRWGQWDAVSLSNHWDLISLNQPKQQFMNTVACVALDGQRHHKLHGVDWLFDSHHGLTSSTSQYQLELDLDAGAGEAERYLKKNLLEHIRDIQFLHSQLLLRATFPPCRVDEHSCRNERMLLDMCARRQALYLMLLSNS